MNVGRYSDKLLRYVREPVNAGALESADAVGFACRHGHAPYVKIFICVSDAIVRKASFEAFGCGATIASASVLTELVENKCLEECRAITATDIIRALDGIPRGRGFCADLAVKALQGALDRYRAKDQQ